MPGGGGGMPGGGTGMPGGGGGRKDMSVEDESDQRRVRNDLDATAPPLATTIGAPPEL
jgi:hypothetical protein